MAAVPIEQLPHLRLINRAVTQDYKPQNGRGPTFRLRQRDRQAHGQNLLDRLNQFVPVIEDRKQQRIALDIEAPSGVTIEFRSHAGFDLAFDSLDVTRSGIELLSVRTTNNITYATCYVPDGKLDILVRRIRAYLEKDTRFNKPQNARLVESIEYIGLATIEALWTDDEPIPQGDEAHWWEVWLRADGMAAEPCYLRFQAAAEILGIRVAQHRLTFPERIVTNIRATRAQLSQAIALLNLTAEIRNADRPPTLPEPLGLVAQDDFVEQLIGRTDFTDSGAAVAILDTGVARLHPLIQPALEAADMLTVNPDWGTHDHDGHGTSMAGMALYGDLLDVAGNGARIDVPFRLESVKILPPGGADGNDDQEVLGAIVAQAVARCEITAPQRRRVLCKAVTSHMHQKGEPSSYSAAIDQLAFARDEAEKRFFAISAGNVQPDEAWLHYPESNHRYGIEQPGQAWNALTVGAYTDKDALPGGPDYAGWAALADRGDLSPFSATSCAWGRWPLKPDVLFEGGNVAVDPSGAITEVPNTLQSLSTNNTFLVHSLAPFGMTSAATALAAGLAGRVMAQYADFWPETVRGLIAHHAQWTAVQKAKYLPNNSRLNKERLLRSCGYGVPDGNRVLSCVKNRVTMVAQETMQPYKLDGTSGKMNEMCLFQLPWPDDMLRELNDKIVRVRVTLSYFIEPSPAKRGWTTRYRYASHGLRFDLQRRNEGQLDFQKRVNVAVRDEEEEIDAPDDEGWTLGDKLRRSGSLHCDHWEGMAIDLLGRKLLAVFPVVGWWRQRINRGCCESQARFSLIVSLECDDADIELYNAIQEEIRVPIDVELG